jgi:hypothetical protein
MATASPSSGRAAASPTATEPTTNAPPGLRAGLSRAPLRPRRHASSFPTVRHRAQAPSLRGRGSDEEVRSLYFEGRRQPIDHIDAGGVDAPLERTDVGSIKIGSVRELFLRQPCRAPIPPQVPREDLPDVHAREGSGLSSILPRSILYNPTPRGPCRCEESPRGAEIGPRVALAPSQVRQAPELNVIHFIVVTAAISRICLLMLCGAHRDASNASGIVTSPSRMLTNRLNRGST